ncbi:t-SNARE [Globomyces pollinis-pini]|nr:t-SNARE [Globomyces pollinis-pini]
MTGSTRQSRITQQTSIAKRLMDTITRFKKLQITSKAQSDERLAREIRHACPDMLESDVKAIVENSNQSASLSNKLLNPRIDNQRLVLESARDRTKQMEQLDQSITQLASMFIMMQEFLEKQQETIDFVESNVENAVVDVEVGSQMMTEAIKIRSETRSRSRIILSALCYLILLIIIVTAVIAFQ